MSNRAERRAMAKQYAAWTCPTCGMGTVERDGELMSLHREDCKTLADSGLEGEEWNE